MRAREWSHPAAIAVTPVSPEARSYPYLEGDYEGVAYDTKEVAGIDENHVYGGFQVKNREFIDCLRSGDQPGSCSSDVVKTIELVELILTQALQKSSAACSCC